MINVFPIPLLEFQLGHYEQRIADARSIEERIFLRKSLHDLKQSSQTFYN